MHNKTSVNFINHRWLLLGLLAVLILFLTFPAAAQEKIDMERAKSLYVSKDPNDHPKRDYQRDINRKAETDKRFEDACRGIIDYEKTVYRSNIGDMDIPVYIFQPMRKRGEKGHAALIWVHGGVHGNLSANYFPFIREAVQRGYVVIAPEYRGSTGYGKEHHESIDYGGYEVDDCLTAYDYMVKNMPHVDPDRVAMIGWSHGGFITAHSCFRKVHPLKCGVAIVPVTNLVFRLSYKGPRYQRNFSTMRRVQGLPFEKREEYIKRSPVYHVDNLQVPILCHIATNDQDVNYVECEMMVHALQVKKPNLAETKIYVDPPGGHSFSRRVNRETLEREDTREQRDSWNRTWTFLEWNLKPYLGK